MADEHASRSARDLQARGGRVDESAGLDFVRLARRYDPSVPVLLQSAANDHSPAVEEMGAVFADKNSPDLLAKIRASLQPIEWRVLQLHYLEGLSGKDVARQLKLSASRICQIHGRVLSKLKTRLGPR